MDRGQFEDDKELHERELPAPRESGQVATSRTDDLSSSGTRLREDFRGRMREALEAPIGTLEPLAAITSVLETPAPDRILAAVMELSRQISLEMHDEEIVHAYAAALKTLFPGRLFVIRLVSNDGALTLAYATGQLHEERRGWIEVTRDALDRHGCAPQSLRLSGVDLADAYRPVFKEGTHGFDVPMLDGSRLAGVLGVEYAHDTNEPLDDRALIGQVALQLGAALRNARLLRESRYLRDYIGKLVDHANMPIAMLGRRRDIRVVNQALLGLAGMRREEVVGKDFLQLLPESERPHLLPVFVSALRGKPVSNFELNIPKTDGSLAQLSLNVASILSADGEVEGVIAIGWDRTEVKELEQQVIQAEKLATLGQLAAGVVHELNNPLTSIAAYGSYLLKKSESRDEDEGDQEKLRRIVHAAERILRFTRDLVTYARPSSEKPQFVRVDRMLDQAVVFCEHVIAEAGATVEKRYAEGLQPVHGVEGRLHQVFINLVTNACHAMPQGAGRLRVEADPVDSNQVEIRVVDNGRGIPANQIGRIFEPFFTTKGEGKGTGLGLSIVRNIVEQHGGAIQVESVVGEETTFIVRLPCSPGSI